MELQIFTLHEVKNLLKDQLGQEFDCTCSAVGASSFFKRKRKWFANERPSIIDPHSR